MKITKTYLEQIIKEELENLDEGWKEKLAGMAAGAAMMAPGVAQAKAKKPNVKPPAAITQKAPAPVQQQKSQTFSVDVNGIDVSFQGLDAGMHEASFELPRGMDREQAKKVIAAAVGKKFGDKKFTMYTPGAIDGVFSATVKI